MATACNLIAYARNPVVIAGQGAIADGPGPALVVFCGQIGAPLAATVGAHGIVRTNLMPYL
ncbi:hypothetical protein [Roseibium sp. M-1]